MLQPDVKHLYAYKPPGEHTREIFTSKQLWFPKPETFNDPFDCDIGWAQGISDEDIIRLARELRGESYIQSFVDKDGKVTPVERARIERVMAEVIDENRDSGVLCLSEVNDSILMWSHYAKNHTGICIEFDRSPNSALGNSEVCSRVEYPCEYPKPDFGEMLEKRNGNTLDLMMRSKASCWAYEKEWRLFRKKGNRAYELENISISRVIFGLRTAWSFKAFIQAHCDALRIPTVQAIKAPREFRIDVPK